MDLNVYYNLLRLLEDGTLPTDITPQHEKKLRTQAKHLFIREGLLYKTNRTEPSRPLRIVKTNEIEAILYNMHAAETAGHFAFEGTYQRTIARYYWPEMGIDIRNYINSCQTCQKFTGRKRKEPLHPIKIGQPFERVGIDLVGPLPETSRGNRYIVVVTEYLTKWPEAKAIPNKQADTIAPFFYDEIICRHGCPKELLSDQGTEFCNQLVTSLCNVFQIRHRLSSAYHPQTNGLVERFNQTLCRSLAKYTSLNDEDWDLFIPSILLAYRTMPHSTTRHEPFYLTYGRDATLPIEFDIPTYPTNEIDENDTLLRRIYTLITKLPETLIEAKKHIRNAQSKEKERRDRQANPMHTFKIGDKTWLSDEVKLRSHSHKFAPKWLGPFYIHDILSYGAYRLRPLDSIDPLPNTYNGNRLKPFIERKTLEPVIII